MAGQAPRPRVAHHRAERLAGLAAQDAEVAPGGEQRELGVQFVREPRGAQVHRKLDRRVGSAQGANAGGRYGGVRL